MLAKSGKILSRTSKYSFWNKFSVAKYKQPIVFVLITFFVIAISFKLYQIRPDSVAGRLLIWKSTFGMIADHPMKGVGLGQFKANYMNYQATYLQNNFNPPESLLADNSIFAFNEFIELTSELGIPGLALALFILFVTFGTTQKSGLSQLIAKSGLMSILVFSMFSYPGSILPIKVLFVFFLAIIANYQKQSRLAIPMSVNIRNSTKLLTVAVLIAFLVLGILNINRVTNACHNWKTDASKLAANKIEHGIELCQKAYPVLKTDGFFMTTYANLLMKNQRYIEAVQIFKEAAVVQPISNIYIGLGDCYLQLEQFGKAGEAYKYALQMVPSRIKPVYKLAQLYKQTNREQDALCEIESYLGQYKIKRTLASYEIELEMIELKKEIENYFKP